MQSGWKLTVFCAFLGWITEEALTQCSQEGADGHSSEVIFSVAMRCLLNDKLILFWLFRTLVELFVVVYRLQ